jgi:hypothetical protein
MVACHGSMIASPRSPGGVPAWGALVTGRSQGPGGRSSRVVLQDSRS